MQADAETRATSTVFVSCRNIGDSPFNAGTCRASFLTCFACRNAVVTTEHLPPLLDLLGELELRWTSTPAKQWWHRYGQAWLSITEDILPTFTPAEVEHARAAADGRSTGLLNLLEGPRET